MKLLILAAIVICISACQSIKPTSASILENCLQAHGYNHFMEFAIDFTFRGKHYSLKRQGGKFSYTRRFSDSTGVVMDELSNAGFRRLLSGEQHFVEEKQQQRLANSLNSVAYFALLPFPLADPAVQKRLLGETTIHGKSFWELEVSFKEEGGGEDFEDVFIYWIDKEDFLLKYLAYRFHTNGGGTRFREAFNFRENNGILLSDYRNFKSNNVDIKIADYEDAFQNGQLTHVSDILLENLVVTKK
ncbi:MAG: DUF6503 family protein [Calditrichia bacterium]